MYQFTTPTVDYPLGSDRLFGRYRYPVGVTVLKNPDGSYYTQHIPSEDQMTAAATVYLGGHVHLVSDSEAAALSAAGYGAGLVAI